MCVHLFLHSFYRGALVGGFVALGIVNALRPLSNVNQGVYFAFNAIALFLSTIAISYLDKVIILPLFSYQPPRINSLCKFYS